MSIFDDIGKEAKHATHSVTHTGGQVFDQIKHATEGAVMEVHHAASDGVNKVKQEGEKAGALQISRAHYRILKTMS